MAEPKALRNRRNCLIFVYAWRDKDHFAFHARGHEFAVGRYRNRQFFRYGKFP